MNSEEIATALRLLDSLYEQKNSVRAWLAGNTTQQESYEEVKRQLESACPGLCVVYVDLLTRRGHVLAPID